MLVFSHFDDKLKNILEIRNRYNDEACILIFAYLDYLCSFTERRYNDNYHNKQNFRHFLMTYSAKADILKYIQVDIFLTHCNNSANIRSEYGHYLDKYSKELLMVKEGEELAITNFFSLNNVEEKDKEFFQNYTIVNRLYELRNFAVHDYSNKFYDGLDSNVPVFTYVDNIEQPEKGWYSVLYPFEFLYEILINCYNKVRGEYENFIHTHYRELLTEDKEGGC